ncbi:hypothetical protein HNQ94_000193 [Salirhabdus euzebyi]|uniref:Uncharacterized protein n=1 Tax=Salirhabdus euzebyi TaxID=394506 RepID=A0A841Q1C2_9BACI|nr:hypothetical protein [Salirhabdus euzebyi]MBB6451772.1 hypothetical protein [Salirhabdus euzebyi]
MKVTLNKIFQTDIGKGKSLLRLKRDLIKFKNKGEIFIREPIAELQQNQTFKLYYFATPNPKSMKEIHFLFHQIFIEKILNRRN